MHPTIAQPCPKSLPHANKYAPTLQPNLVIATVAVQATVFLLPVGKKKIPYCRLYNSSNLTSETFESLTTTKSVLAPSTIIANIATMPTENI